MIFKQLTLLRLTKEVQVIACDYVASSLKIDQSMFINNSRRQNWSKSYLLRYSLIVVYKLLQEDYYNLRLDSGCNLGKDLNKSRE